MHIAHEISYSQYRILSVFVQQEKCFLHYAEKLHDYFFTEPAFRHIFEAMRYLHATRATFDKLMLHDYLHKHQHESAISWLEGMEAEYLHGFNLDIEINLLQENSVRTMLHQLGADLLQKSNDKNIPVDTLKQLLNHTWYELNEALPSSSSSTLKQLIEKWQSQLSNNESLSWFNEELNGLLNGLYGGELIVIGARPGIGKTCFLHMQLIHMAMQQKQAVGYINLIESEDTLTAKINRTLSAMGVHGKEELPLYLCTKPGSNDVRDVLQACRFLAHKYQLKALAIDCFQQITYRQHLYYRDYELGRVLQQIKQLAKELNIPIILTSQLSRAAEKRGISNMPMLSDLKDTGYLEEVADKVILLYRYAYYGITEYENGVSTSNDTEVIVAKNKDGHTGTVTMEFHSDYALFKPKEVVAEIPFEFPESRLHELE